MGEFNSDDHYMYSCGQEAHRRNGVAFIINKNLKCSTWVQSQKWQNDLVLFPRQTSQHHSNPNLGPNHLCQKSWSWSVLWRPTRSPRTNTKKRCPIYQKNWNAKVGCQQTPGVTGKFGLGVQNEAGERLTEFWQKNAPVIANILFQQH